jgi:hypothetical protein
MPSHVCYHCKTTVEEGEAHACWVTTEEALTRELTDDLRDAWERLRETAAEFGEQRIYASHRCIMFSRKACYFFVRPKRQALELVVFLGRLVKAPQVRRTERASHTKIGHIIHVRHRDEVEAPITDWLKEAYDRSDALSVRPAKAVKTAKVARAAKTAKPARAAKNSSRRAPSPRKKR